MELVIGGIYRHFKGKECLVEDIALDSETCKEMVVYRELCDDHKLYVRDKEMFLSKTDKEKYPDIEQEYRFEFIKEIKKEKCRCNND